ncbi:hypothetical protein F4802DRAFT_225222 [Xylaria palmicola]|nr:hypothetical protein F4802DRAFT_225222 [Xylaria palmicola]
MHILSSSALPLALLNLLLLNTLPTVGAVSDRAICVRENAAMLAEAAVCGDRRSLQECFLTAPNFVALDYLQSCFEDVDCTITEALSEAAIILQGCDADGPAPELRRRGAETIPVATPTPAPQDKKTPVSTGPAAATTTAALTRPTVCSTGRMVETTVCPVTSLGENDFSKLPCTSTTLATMECAATNVCFDDGGCVFRHDGLEPSGIAAAVVLALVAAAAAAVLLYFYALERRKRRAAREEDAEEKRKIAQLAAEEALRQFAKTQVEQERLRRQQMEAREWAHRRALESPRPGNPFADSAAAPA